MKCRITGMLLALTMAVALVSCNTAQQENSDSGKVAPMVSDSSLQDIPITHKSIVLTEDYYYDASNLKELEKLSDYVVRGSLLDDAKQKLYYSDPDIIDTAYFGITVSSFKISKVFKGNLKEGETIRIAERYFAQEKNGEMVQYLEGYGPSEPNKEYIFFLLKEDDKNEFLKGYYAPSLREKGRYPMPESTSFAKASTNSVDEFTLVSVKQDEYNSLYQEVSTKYFSK